MGLLVLKMGLLSLISCGELLVLKQKSGWRKGYLVPLTGQTINQSKLMALISILSSLQVVCADLLQDIVLNLLTKNFR